MKKYENIKEVYEQCQVEGIIKFRKDIDVELAKSILKSAKEDFNFSKEIEKTAEKKQISYSFLYKSRYDILRQALDAIALFDKVISSNHKCMIAYICTMHPELDLDWETIETMRKLRNNMQYRGKRIDGDDWKVNKVMFEIYIKSLIKHLESKCLE
ncbi:hypothetical protein CMO93_01035 [Candidatus Woesearchaeota archaeon]|nr:hypothetical protein [Candidatus Woesearchaeota archaeon]|tara:strand:- start:1114 stop:1581 length:468 start_codon:yes stop_codon:yes gene_type:complete